MVIQYNLYASRIICE